MRLIALESQKRGNMKSIMLLGALAGATTANVAPVVENNKMHRQYYPHGRNLIDLSYLTFSEPRFILHDIEIHSASSFERIDSVHGEVDKCGTFYHHAEWYKDNPERDPSPNSMENTGHVHVKPTTFSETLGNINRFIKNKYHDANRARTTTWWADPIDGSQSTIITLAFRDEKTFETQEISLYYNVGTLTSHPNDDCFVGVIPGTKIRLNSDHQSIKELNVIEKVERCNSGVLEEDHNHGSHFMFVPALFGHAINLNNVQFEYGALSDKVISPYIMTGRAGRGGASSAYYGDLLSGFEKPMYYSLPNANFRQGANLFNKVAHSFALYLYKVLNDPVHYAHDNQPLGGYSWFCP